MMSIIIINNHNIIIRRVVHAFKSMQRVDESKTLLIEGVAVRVRLRHWDQEVAQDIQRIMLAVISAIDVNLHNPTSKVDSRPRHGTNCAKDNGRERALRTKAQQTDSPARNKQTHDSKKIVSQKLKILTSIRKSGWCPKNRKFCVTLKSVLFHAL